MDWLRGWLMVGCALTLLGGGHAEAQCADGTVEHDFVPGRVVGCGGAWTEPGLTSADGAPVEPSCDRRAGNDGDLRSAEEMRGAGVTCTAADLCGLGWSLCVDEDATDLGTRTCADAAIEDAFYAAATTSCDSTDGGTHLVGCGSLGCDSSVAGALCSLFNRRSGFGEDPCATLNQTGCNMGFFLDGAGWSCPLTAAGESPVSQVTKAGGAHGGVLCCFREVCDCVDDAGNCHAFGEMPEPCLVCEGDGDPAAPLTRIEDCSADGGVIDVDGGVIPGTDLGTVPADPDLGSELPNPDPEPGISFRGDGGCECRAAPEGAPTFGLVALVLFAWRRRR